MALRVHVFPIMRLTVEVDPSITDPKEAVEFAMKAAEEILPGLGNNMISKSHYPVVDAGYADDFDQITEGDGQTAPLVVVDEVDGNGQFVKEVGEWRAGAVQC